LVVHEPSEAPEAKQDLIGRRLMDRYRVEERIARGGMAVVFRGLDERLHRPVCVKVFFGFDPLQAEYAVVLEHFVQEAFALSRLKHPATLRIYDFGYLDDEARTGPYFVTEMADGGHLGDLLAEEGPMSPSQMLRVLHPLIGALREAHDAGIVHRDLKPSNILFAMAGGTNPTPKLADFSIAKASGDLPNRASDTNAAVPLYSLSWAAPEQLADQPVEPTADVFALALVVAFMLTEQLVYPGSDVMQLYSLRAEGPAYREAAIRCLGLPPALEAVVIDATAEDPHARPQSVDEFFEELEKAVGESSVPPPNSTFTPPVSAPDVDDDDLPTDQHARFLPGMDAMSPPPPTRPEAAPGPAWAPSPVLPLTPRAKPHLTLSSLDPPQCVIGNRRMRLHEMDGELITLPRAIADRPAKLRITPMELGPGRAHLKGLNCFLQHPQGRPSSGLDVDGSAVLHLLDPQSGARGEVIIALGRDVHGNHELELSDVVIVVPSALARWAAVLESAGGRDTTLVFVRHGQGPGGRSK
jgi:serine/threonine-protein kinase